MSVSPRLIFFGNERLSTGFEPQGAPTLQALIDDGYDIAAVVSNFHTGTSRTARKLEIETVAAQYNIPVLLPQKPADIINQLRDFNAVAGVLVAYGRIIPQAVIDIFPRGIINIHPSLLPNYRGSTPIEQAILDGAPQTGVSIMQLVKQMDAGPVFAQTTIDLNGSETKQTLTQRLLTLGGELLLQNLSTILKDELIPSPQDEAAATYCPLFTKASAVMDFSKPAVQLEREVRAYAGWPKCRATVLGHDVIVLRARVADNQTDGALVMSCGDQTYLEILELTAPSGSRMDGGAFMRGYSRG